MTKNEMETFRHQLLKLERTFKDDASTLADEAFHKSDGMAVDNLSNIPVEDRAELGADENAKMRRSACSRTQVLAWRQSTPPLSESTTAPSVAVKSAARKSHVTDSRPSPIHGSASSVLARHNNESRRRRVTCRPMNSVQKET